jgi:hypothetical protein
MQKVPEKREVAKAKDKAGIHFNPYVDQVSRIKDFKASEAREMLDNGKELPSQDSWYFRKLLDDGLAANGLPLLVETEVSNG